MEADQYAMDAGLPPSPRKEPKAKEEVPVIHRFDEPFKDFGRRRWYNGCWSYRPDIVFMDSRPGVICAR